MSSVAKETAQVMAVLDRVETLGVVAKTLDEQDQRRAAIFAVTEAPWPAPGDWSD